jgi:hypothetical protein
MNGYAVEIAGGLIVWWALERSKPKNKDKACASHP